MYRAFIRLENANRAALPSAEIHHLVRVRRSKEGREFLGLDGSGDLYRCRLGRDRQGWFAEVLEGLDIRTESPLRLVLGQALVKKDKFEWVIQKSTELGVDQIVPLKTHRSELNMDGERELKRRGRWEKILSESVKQCGRTSIPTLGEISTPLQFLDSIQADLTLVLDEVSDQPLSAFLGPDDPEQKRSVAVLVGPEGGWHESERALFEGRPVTRFRLGPRVLRTETAPIAILAVLQFLHGDF